MDVILISYVRFPNTSRWRSGYSSTLHYVIKGSLWGWGNREKKMKKFLLPLLLLFVVVGTTVRAQTYDERYDINKDGKVSIADVTALVNHILGKTSGSFTKCPDNNHPHAIDLGLPSGTKWCCCNVGASTPEGYGGYYAWGETSEKSVYYWDTYQYGSSWDNVVNIGSDIAGTNYDVAHVRMGAPWRMPSTAQQQELINNCSWQWTQQNGVNGILVTGSNGGQIFLPAAGRRWDDVLYDAGEYGIDWSSSLYPGGDFIAYGMYFGSDRWYWCNDNRSSGFSVRAVCP